MDQGLVQWRRELTTVTGGLGVANMEGPGGKDFRIFATPDPPVVNSRRNWTLAVLSGYSELGEPPQHPTSFILCVVTTNNRPTRSLRRWACSNKN